MPYPGVCSVECIHLFLQVQVADLLKYGVFHSRCARWLSCARVAQERFEEAIPRLDLCGRTRYFSLLSDVFGVGQDSDDVGIVVNSG